MSKNDTIIDESVDIIDNKLESISFFPIRFICYIISFACFYPLILSLYTLNLGALFICVFFFFPTLAIAIVQKRITVDLANMQYKEYLNFAGIKTKNKWYSFKGFKIITVTHSDKILRMNSKYGGAEVTSSNSSVFYLNLKKDNFNKLNIAAGSYKEIFSKALNLSHRFEMDIVDCSEKPNKKLDYAFIEKKYPNHSL